MIIYENYLYIFLSYEYSNYSISKLTIDEKHKVDI